MATLSYGPLLLKVILPDDRMYGRTTGFRELDTEKEKNNDNIEASKASQSVTMLVKICQGMSSYDKIIKILLLKVRT